MRHGLYVTCCMLCVLVIVVDHGTCSVPLFVVLECDRLKALMDFVGEHFPTGLAVIKEPLWDKGIGSLNRLSDTCSTGGPAGVGDSCRDRLSKRKFVIVCHEKVVRIPLEGDEILRVHGERTQGVVKTLMNTKVDLVHGTTLVAKSPYRLAPSEMQELSEQLQELQDEVLELLRKEKLYAKFTKSEKGRVILRRVRAMSITIQSDVKDKILATLSETSKVENAPAEILLDLDQQMEKRADDGCTLWIKLYIKHEYEIRYYPGRVNVVIDVLRRKERVKPRRVRAMAMTIQYGVRGTILAGQSKAFKQENVLAERLRRACVIDFGGSYQLSIRCAPFEALYGRKCRSPVIWAEIGGSSLIGPELVQETTNKVGDRVMLKVSPWKDDLRFGKKEPVKNSDCEVKRLKCSRMVVVKVYLSSKRECSCLMSSEDGCKMTLLFGKLRVFERSSMTGEAKLLAVRYLVKVSWNSKGNFELTWLWEDYLKDKYP
ncbi:hypothetical protein Tco_1032758 [Tanacetum coccineum]|uniref:Reverse transcriptase domain-containing protein n=1 Tax=Tanacetum coccineum TaxID=301880 RepID=A0ABQ5GCQ5_9ASTR